MLTLVYSTIIQILLEHLGLLHKQRQVRLRTKVLINIVRDIGRSVRRRVAADKRKVPQDVGLDVLGEDEVDRVGRAPVGREPAEPLEEVRVRKRLDGRVRRVVAVGPEVVRRRVPLRQVRRRLPPRVAAAAAADVAVREGRGEGVDARVAGYGEGCGFRGGVGGGGFALVDCAVGVDAEEARC